jgi:hypothetical protein
MTGSPETMAGFGAVGSTDSAPYGELRATRNDLTQRATRPPVEEPAGLVEWLATPAARELVGQWVLLTPDYEVIDYASRPSELLDRHPDNRSPFIVFVRPRNIRPAR